MLGPEKEFALFLLMLMAHTEATPLTRVRPCGIGRQNSNLCELRGCCQIVSCSDMRTECKLINSIPHRDSGEGRLRGTQSLFDRKRRFEFESAFNPRTGIAFVYAGAPGLARIGSQRIQLKGKAGT